MRRLNVYFSDFRDIPGLKAHFVNFLNNCSNFRVIRITDTFIEVESIELFLKALYTG